MTMPLGNGFPPHNPFPESLVDTLGDGAPDFPFSAGGREQGKFRPGRLPKTTTVAVVNDDGSPIMGEPQMTVEEATLLEMKAIRLGIQMLLAQANIGVDLLEAAAND